MFHDEPSAVQQYPHVMAPDLLENVTSDPGAHWTAQQIVEAFPEDTASEDIIVIDNIHADRVLKQYVRYYHGRPFR